MGFYKSAGFWICFMSRALQPALKTVCVPQSLELRALWIGVKTRGMMSFHPRARLSTEECIVPDELVLKLNEMERGLTLYEPMGLPMIPASQLPEWRIKSLRRYGSMANLLASSAMTALISLVERS